MAVPATARAADQAPAAEPEPAPGTAPRLAAREEHRFAVVLYGGTSLAVYISGVARELLELVRATAPADLHRPWDTTARQQDEALAGGTAEVYRRLARLLSDTDPDEPAAPIRTRFVVDILSGTSAGGLNGVFLARALVCGGTLDHLRDVWLDDGAIDCLVNDPDSLRGIEDPPLELDEPIGSVLNGRRMYRRIRDTLRAVRPDPTQPALPLVEQLDLFVTATDLEGVVVPIRLADRLVYERRHRKVFHYAFPKDAQRGDDFAEEALEQLAAAARSTSAFPVAFPPMSLSAARPPIEVPEAWGRRWYGEYDPTRFRDRQFSDGGILDNKPFSYATHALGSRTASLPVHRRLLYVEPRPGGRGADSGRDFSPVDVAQAALTSIPRAETIGEDIQWVEERNRLLMRARDVLANIEGSVRWDAFDEMPDIECSEWRTIDVDMAATAYGVGFHAYHRLRRGTSLDHLATLVARGLGLDPNGGGDRLWAVRRVVAAWYERELGRIAEERAEVDTAGGRRPVIPDRAYLADFDIAYRLRRVDFALRRAHELAGEDSRAHELVEGLEHADGAAQAAVAAELAALREGLRMAAGRVRAGEEELICAVAGRREALELTDAVLDEVVADRDVDRVAPVVVAGRVDALDELADAWRGTLGRAAVEAHALALEVLARREGDDLPARVRGMVRRVFETFEAYDVLTLPLTWGTPIGEGSPVEVLRVSPQDAASLRETMPGRVEARLAGTTLNNFGGFLQRSWRRHDFAWGRLDAAERLITTLRPLDTPQRRELLRATRERIIRDEFTRPEGQAKGDEGPFFDPAAETSALEWFQQRYELPRLQPEAGLQVLRRTAIVLRGVGRAQVERLDGAPRHIARFGFWLANLLFARHVALAALAALGLAIAVTGLVIGWSWMVLLGLEVGLVAGAVAAAGWWLSRRIRGWLGRKTAVDPAPPPAPQGSRSTDLA